MRNLEIFETYSPDKVYIKVILTKDYNFRVFIEKNKNKYSVTVGGEQWNKGVGREYEKLIQEKCKKVARVVAHRYLHHFMDPDGKFDDKFNELLDEINREQDAEKFGL